MTQQGSFVDPLCDLVMALQLYMYCPALSDKPSSHTKFRWLGGVLGRGFSGVTRRTATGPSEAVLSPAAALAHVPGMAKGRVAYEKRAWRVEGMAGRIPGNR